MSTKKVAMVVLNSVSHDVRVKKEAESLSKSAYQVYIFGVRDKRDSRPVNFLQNGTKVVRVDIQTVLRGLKALIESLFLSFFFLILTLPLLSRKLSATGINMHLIIVPAGLIGIAFSSYFLFNSIAIYHKFSFQLREEYPPNSKDKKSKRNVLEILILKKMAVVTKLMRNLMRDKVIQWRIIRELLSIKPDVVHCHDLNTLAIGYKMKKETGCSLVYDSHEIYEHMSTMERPIQIYYRWVQKRCSKLVDHFITINDSIQGYLNQQYPNLPRGIVIKNATVYQKHFPRYDGRLHEKAKLEQGIRVLLYQGGFTRHRGLEALVLSAPLLREGWVLVMMGWGKLESELKAIGDKIDPKQKKVRFIPAVPQKDLLYWTQGASVGIIPYENTCLNHWYCSPNKLWEYPNAGVPVVVSPFPELRKAVIGNNIGWLLRKLSPEGIAETVNGIAENDLTTKTEACRKFASQDNWSLYEERLLNVYRTLFSETANPSIVN